MRLVQLIFLSTLGQRGDKTYLELAGFEPSLATEQASTIRYIIYSGQ